MKFSLKNQDQTYEEILQDMLDQLAKMKLRPATEDDLVDHIYQSRGFTWNRLSNEVRNDLNILIGWHVSKTWDGNNGLSVTFRPVSPPSWVEVTINLEDL